VSRCGGRRQQSVAITLIGAQNVAKFLGHGDHDMEVMGRQQFGLTMCEPRLGLVGVTLGTAAIPTRVIRKHPMAAMIAPPEMPPEHLCTASENVGDGPAMRRRHHSKPDSRLDPTRQRRRTARDRRARGRVPVCRMHIVYDVRTRDYLQKCPPGSIERIRYDLSPEDYRGADFEGFSSWFARQQSALRNLMSPPTSR
jgi:hypothetical protein